MESSSRSRTWEEQIYWKNFHFAHIFVTLPTDFRNRLTLPKKFTDYMRTELPEQTVLKVNRVSWNVNLKKDKDDIMFQGDGWEEFVNIYSLKKADILVFKYIRRECFEVLLFDRASSCEKEASYFVRKVQQQNSDDDEEDHDCNKETDENYDSDCNAPRNRRRKNPGRTPKSYSVRTARTEDGFSDQDESDKTSDEEDSVSEETETTPKKAGTRASKSPSNSLSKRRRRGVNKIIRKESKSPGLYQLLYKSNRRAITEPEIANALEKAKVAATQYHDKFIVVMRPTCVYKRFYLTIPSEWNPRSRLRKGQEVSLRVEGKTGKCRVSCSSNAIGFQGSGWRDFVRDNYLEEFDVCLFVPSGSKNEISVLEVSIFRVVPEVVPTTLQV